MKIKVKFFVVKLNSQIVEATPISEIYDRVQINLDFNHLTKEDVLKYYDFMNESARYRALADVIDKNCLQDEQEAKDLVVRLSEYELYIIEKDVELD